MKLHSGAQFKSNREVVLGGCPTLRQSWNDFGGAIFKFNQAIVDGLSTRIECRAITRQLRIEGAGAAF